MDKFKTEDINKFIHDHIQSKIDHNELGKTGFDMENAKNFEKEIELYTLALFEGICNGILMCGGKIEGIDT